VRLRESAALLLFLCNDLVIDVSTQLQYQPVRKSRQPLWTGGVSSSGRT
jgi:hypothetical protein